MQKRKPMSQALFKPKTRLRLRHLAESGHFNSDIDRQIGGSRGLYETNTPSVAFVDFEGRRLAIKLPRKWNHPDLREYAKAIKLTYNELRKIWKLRMQTKKEKPLYTARFFDIAHVSPEMLITEAAGATPVSIIFKSARDKSRGIGKFRPGEKEEKEKVMTAYQQLSDDVRLALDNTGLRDKIIKAGEKQIVTRGDYGPNNIMFEGFDDQGRAQFILMDIIKQEEKNRPI